MIARGVKGLKVIQRIGEPGMNIENKDVEGN